MFRFRLDRGVLILVLAALTATGCVKQNDPGVAIDKVQARLVFGIKEETPIAPSAAQAALELPADDPFDNGLLDLDFEGDDDFVIPPPQDDRDEMCPQPEPGAGVKVPAQNFVGETRPKEGIYIYRQTHRVTLEDGSEEVVRDQFVPRALRKVTKVNDTTFTYETLDPGPDDTTIVTVWQVKEEPPPVDPPIPPAGANPPRTGGPERGLVMKKRYVLDSTGTQSGDYRAFDAEAGLLILPLKVTPGESFTSVATDRRSLDTYTANQEVRSIRRHNACGELTDGWHVFSTQTFTSSANDPGEFPDAVIDYIIGTQFGAMVVWDEVAFDGEGGTGEYLTTGLASLKVLPLPEALK